MFDFFQDNFDTNTLGIVTYKLFFQNDVVSNDILEKRLNEISKPSMICCVTPFNQVNLELLHNNGFKLISTKNIYKNNVELLPINNKGFSKEFTLVRKTSGELINLDLDFSDMINTIAEKGRYSKDSLIPKDKALTIYKEWINNSINHDFADEIILVLLKEKIAGMITLKIVDSKGSIDLIIVDPSFQRRGIGNVLLFETRKYLMNNDIKEIVVETEGENIGANKFYQRNGFLLHDFRFVFHKHIL